MTSVSCPYDDACVERQELDSEQPRPDQCPDDQVTLAQAARPAVGTDAGRRQLHFPAAALLAGHQIPSTGRPPASLLALPDSRDDGACRSRGGSTAHEPKRNLACPA
jgi:hypothetical protein